LIVVSSLATNRPVRWLSAKKPTMRSVLKSSDNTAPRIAELVLAERPDVVGVGVPGEGIATRQRNPGG
jgi:hypothetical protein